MTRPIASTLLTLTALAAALACFPSAAKLPAPSDDAKAKAAEAAAKAAYTGKVEGYQLCQAMNRVAASYQATAAKSGKAASAPINTPACADPGVFVVAPAGAASAPAGAAVVSASTPASAPAPTLAKK